MFSRSLFAALTVFALAVPSVLSAPTCAAQSTITVTAGAESSTAAVSSSSADISQSNVAAATTVSSVTTSSEAESATSTSESRRRKNNGGSKNKSDSESSTSAEDTTSVASETTSSEDSSATATATASDGSGDNDDNDDSSSSSSRSSSTAAESDTTSTAESSTGTAVDAGAGNTCAAPSTVTVTETVSASNDATTNVAAETSTSSAATSTSTSTKGKGGSKNKGESSSSTGDATTSRNAAASTTSAATSTSTGGNSGSGSGSGNGNDEQSATTLNAAVIATGFAQDGQATPAAGQVASLTSTNNYINFCLTVDKPITNGQQIKTGSCNPAPIGVIAATTNMPASKFANPKNFDTIQANTAFTIQMAINNLETGNFVNAQTNYYSAPQQVNAQGNIIGHSHVVIEQLDSLNQTTVTDPTKFAFFKGINGAAVNGVVTADVTDGLPAGAYRMASINAAANHQPVLVAVAQHGSLDDMVYFTVE